MTKLAFHPPDQYHQYSADPWDSTEVESDSSTSLREEGKRRGTILSKVPPNEEELENPLLLRDFVWRVSQGLDPRGSSPEPPSPSLSPSSPPPLPPLSLPLPPSSPTAALFAVASRQATPTPVPIPLPVQLHTSAGLSNDISAVALRRDKRTRVDDLESPRSESDLPPKKKCSKRPVLHPIPNGTTVISPPTAEKTRTVDSATRAPFPSLDPPPVPSPVASTYKQSTSKQPRRTMRELQQAVEGKARPSIDDSSHICKIGGCQDPLPWQNIEWSRDHIAEHYTKYYAGKDASRFACLRPGCSTVCTTIYTATRHFEGHLLWGFPCPNVVRGCSRKPYSRADSQKRHTSRCLFGPTDDNAIPGPTEDDYAADSEI